MVKLADHRLYYSSNSPAYVRSHAALLGVIQALAYGVYALDESAYADRVKAFRLVGRRAAALLAELHGRPPEAVAAGRALEHRSASASRRRSRSSSSLGNQQRVQLAAAHRGDAEVLREARQEDLRSPRHAC